MAAQQLLEKGVVVIKVQEDMHAYVARILNSITEVKNPAAQIATLDHKIDATHPQTLVLGAFGALGLPSTSHSLAARDLREHIYQKMYPVFAEMFPDRNLEMLFDRFGIRREGSDPTEEDWHRDEGPRSPGDVIYGGFLNLNAPGNDKYGQKRSQFFTCVPGNVLPVLEPGDEDNVGKGFNRFETDDKQELEKKQEKFEVPPGHIIVFNQTIAHTITQRIKKRPEITDTGGNVLTKQGAIKYVRVPAPVTSYRQYFGWRITDTASPYISKADVINNQSPPPLPSGQPSTMYADYHWINHVGNVLIPFSNTLKNNKNFFEYKPMETTGVTYYIVKHVLDGLVPMGPDFSFRPYSPREISIMLPRNLKRGGVNDTDRELLGVEERLKIGLHEYLPGKEPKPLNAREVIIREASKARVAKFKNMFKYIPRKRMAKLQFLEGYWKTKEDQMEVNKIKAYNQECADEDAVRKVQVYPVASILTRAPQRGVFNYSDNDLPVPPAVACLIGGINTPQYVLPALLQEAAKPVADKMYGSGGNPWDRQLPSTPPVTDVVMNRDVRQKHNSELTARKAEAAKQKRSANTMDSDDDDVSIAVLGKAEAARQHANKIDRDARKAKAAEQKRSANTMDSDDDDVSIAVLGKAEAARQHANKIDRDAREAEAAKRSANTMDIDDDDVIIVAKTTPAEIAASESPIFIDSDSDNKERRTISVNSSSSSSKSNVKMEPVKAVHRAAAIATQNIRDSNKDTRMKLAQMEKAKDALAAADAVGPVQVKKRSKMDNLGSTGRKMSDVQHIAGNPVSDNGAKEDSDDTTSDSNSGDHMSIDGRETDKPDKLGNQGPYTGHEMEMYTDKESEIIQMYNDQRNKDAVFVTDQRDVHDYYADKIDDFKIARYAIMFNWKTDGTRFEIIRKQLQNRMLVIPPETIPRGMTVDADNNSVDGDSNNAYARQKQRDRASAHQDQPDNDSDKNYTKDESAIIDMYKEQRDKDKDFVEEQREKYEDSAEYKDYADKIEDVKIARYAIMFNWKTGGTRFEAICKQLLEDDMLDLPDIEGMEVDEGNNSVDEFGQNAFGRQEQRNDNVREADGNDSEYNDPDSDKEEQDEYER